MKINVFLNDFKKIVSAHSWQDGFHFLFMSVVNKVISVRVLRCIVIKKVNDKFLSLDARYSPEFLSAEQLQSFARDRENALTESFLKEALSHGDECYGVTEAGELAAYGWYSRGATPTDVYGLNFNFDPSYVYMYKGLTKDKYRGQRLHAIGMTRALQSYLERGCLGMVSYVESLNFDSLKSCWRMGYQPAGSVYVVKIFGKIFCFSSDECGQFGIFLNQNSASLKVKSNLETV